MAKDRFCPECGACIDEEIYSADKMRAAFFANLHETWASLPDHMRQRFPSSEVLRKHALCAVGHCDVLRVTAGSKTAAFDVANAFRFKDRYCITNINGSVVDVLTARSMARRALPKEQFRAVAEQVNQWIAEQTAIDPRKAAA